MTGDRGRATLWIGSVSAIIAALSYSSFLLSPWTDAASSASGGFVSELEDPGQPFAWLYRTSDVLAGVGILVAAWALWRLVAGRRWAATGVTLFALTGASSVLDAVTSMQCDPGTSAQCAQNEHTTLGLISQLLALHTDSGLLGFVGSAAGAAVVGVAVAGRWPVWGRLQIALGIAMASCGLADIALLLLSSSIGTTERTRVLLTSGWFLAVGLFLAVSARRLPPAPGESRAAPDRARLVMPKPSFVSRTGQFASSVAQPMHDWKDRHAGRSGCAPSGSCGLEDRRRSPTRRWR